MYTGIGVKARGASYTLLRPMMLMWSGCVFQLGTPAMAVAMIRWRWTLLVVCQTQLRWGVSFDAGSVSRDLGAEMAFY